MEDSSGPTEDFRISLDNILSRCVADSWGTCLHYLKQGGKQALCSQPSCFLGWPAGPGGRGRSKVMVIRGFALFLRLSP